MQSIVGISFAVISTMTGLWFFPQGAKDADDKNEPKHTVVEVMQGAMKKGQWKKLASGEATKEESAKLIGLLEDLHQNRAPHGDAKSWETKTQAILDAAVAAEKREPGAGDRLKKVMDCRGCHRAHKEE